MSKAQTEFFHKTTVQWLVKRCQHTPRIYRIKLLSLAANYYFYYRKHDKTGIYGETIDATPAKTATATIARVILIAQLWQLPIKRKLTTVLRTRYRLQDGSENTTILKGCKSWRSSIVGLSPHYCALTHLT